MFIQELKKEESTSILCSECAFKMSMHVRCECGRLENPSRSVCMSLSHLGVLLQNSARTDTNRSGTSTGDPTTFLRSCIINYSKLQTPTYYIQQLVSSYKNNRRALTREHVKKYNSFFHYLLLNNNRKLCTQTTQEEECQCNHAGTPTQHADSLLCTQRQQGDGWLSPTQFESKHHQ